MNGLGIFRPPHTVRRVPRPAVTGLEDWMPSFPRHRPFVHMGRFVVLDMARR